MHLFQRRHWSAIMVKRERAVDRIKAPVKMFWQFCNVRLKERTIVKSLALGIRKCRCDHRGCEVNTNALAVWNHSCQSHQFRSGSTTNIENARAWCHKPSNDRKSFVMNGSSCW